MLKSIWIVLTTFVVIYWKTRLGEEIAKARRLTVNPATSKKMTQEELADAAELCRNTIGLFERGKRAPDVDELRKIARVLSKDRFEIDDNLRIEFTRNGKPHLEPVAHQLTLKFDEGESVNVRIECKSDGLIIMKADRTRIV
jgi:transcriptional regulator with XRE-family HTH domain